LIIGPEENVVINYKTTTAVYLERKRRERYILHRSRNKKNEERTERLVRASTQQQYDALY
jgi:hypothetical protein